MSKLFNPDYLLYLCQKYNLRPSSKYGQNFLINEEPIEVMLDVAEVSKRDMIVEIGPGFGVLTFALAERAGRVISYEIEKKLENYWTEQIKNNNLKNLEIVWGNVLFEATRPHTTLPLKGEGVGSAPPFKEGIEGWSRSPYKVVANLPYQITSPVIRKFLELKNPPEVMVLMVQKEVAERICAKAGEMSLLAVAVQYYAEAEIIMQVPHVYFWPEPRVDSAIIKVHSPKSIVQSRSKEFFEVVKAGFSQKRKFLIKNLLPLVSKQKKGLLNKVFEELGIPLTARAQELSVKQWIDLAKLVILCYNTDQ